MDPKLMRARLGAGRVGRLATITRDGRPHIVPCCFALVGDVVYSAIDDMKAKSTSELRRLANIRVTPRASLLVDHYDDDWTALWWVRVDGAAVVVGDGTEQSEARQSLAAKYPQYANRPPPGDVIAIAIDDWRAWSAQ